MFPWVALLFLTTQCLSLTFLSAFCVSSAVATEGDAPVTLMGDIRPGSAALLPARLPKRCHALRLYRRFEVGV